MRALVLVLLVTGCAARTVTPAAPTPVTPNQVELQILPPTGDAMAVPPMASLTTWIAPDAPCNRTSQGQDPAIAQTNPNLAEVDDPFFDHAGKVCLVPLPEMAPGTYRAAAVFIAPECRDDVGNPVAPCRSPRSLLAVPVIFVKTLEGACLDRPVRIDVGEWTRTVPRTGYGRVSYSLLASTKAVTLLVVKFNGVEHDILQGSDLRRVSGSYFEAGDVAGSYQLTVEAYDAAGCVDGADRPMTVVVE